MLGLETQFLMPRLLVPTMATMEARKDSIKKAHLEQQMPPQDCHPRLPRRSPTQTWAIH